MPSHKVELSWDDGRRIAHRFLENVEPIVGMRWFRIAGSIRRLKQIVHDVDIVFKPLCGPELPELVAFCERAPNVTVHKWGPKLGAISYCGTPIDLYFSQPETFNTLLLIRTGSMQNNIQLATIAKRKGWKLHASGDGLFNGKNERIAGDSERSIYDALGVKWQEPWERG